jgi:hypothetical protein
MSTMYGSSAANEPNKANLKINVPSRQCHKYISSQLNKGKNEFYISIKVNLDTGKIISARLGICLSERVSLSTDNVTAACTRTSFLLESEQAHEHVA